MQRCAIRQLDGHKKDFHQQPDLRSAENGVRLIPIKKSDFSLFSKLYQTPATMRFIAAPLKQQTTEALFSYVLQQQNVKQPRCAYWTISVDGSGSCGLIGLMFEDTDSAEIGIMLNGVIRVPKLADKAMSRVLRYAFENLKKQQVIAHIKHENIPAINLGKRLGFRFVKAVTENDGDGLWLVDKERFRSALK
ncbi:N-acetyltransferase [Corallincola luteus]|uniref:N-acetyltransferase n=1 Tax=Corallincola luteus TaxID=1775177 RepID=A0ABY2AMD3_9GAMM|nr:GNAT family N-acetyltransferase [Corallincola luteus]TCI03380.1 N-acetyltransferase [Corallincola luteus]